MGTTFGENSRADTHAEQNLRRYEIRRSIERILDEAEQRAQLDLRERIRNSTLKGVKVG